MLCQKCKKNNANVRIVKNINGKVEEKYLCSQCADNDEDNFETNFFKDDFFDNFMNFFTGSPLQSSLSCKNCNTDFNSFQKTGLLGCPECYIQFEKYLNPILKNIHGSTMHIGKRPGLRGESNPDKEVSEIDNLKSCLKKAIDSENYEEAAILRDKIKALSESK